MVVPLIASALLLDFFGCMMPLALVEDTKAFKVGVFLIWAALVADSVLMGLFYPRELAGVNPLLAAGLEPILRIMGLLHSSCTSRCSDDTTPSDPPQGRGHRILPFEV